MEATAPCTLLNSVADATTENASQIKLTAAVDKQPPASMKGSNLTVEEINGTAQNKISSELEEGDSSPRGHLLTIGVFTLVGISCLFPWNAVLNVLYDLVAYVYHDAGAADTIVIVFETFMVLFVLTYAVIGAIRPFQLLIACILGMILMAAFPLIPLLFEGHVGLILLHSIAAPLGMCVGCVLSTGMALASIMKFNYTGYVAFGIGVSGMLSFGLWMMFDRLVFIRVDKYSEEGRLALVNTLWMVFGVGSAVLLATGLGIYWFLQKSWFKDKVDKYWKEVAEKENNNLDKATILKSNDTRPMLKILKDCWQQLFNIGFTLWIQMLIFPLVGPFEWVGSLVDQHIGIVQVCDFIGRYIPNFGDSVKLSKRSLFFLVLLRITLIALYAFPMVFTNTVFNEFWLQAILSCVSALTNGYCITLATIYAPSCVDNEKEKGKVGAYVTVSMQVGVLLGVYASKLYKEVLVLAMAG